jgi:nucleotide-binding universal stress UspA family protein
VKTSPGGSGPLAQRAPGPGEIKQPAPRRLLLAHHGTEGAARAAQLAWQFAVAGETTVVHLYVVPEFWSGMQGDDWLNNAWTRDKFAAHLESKLEDEARAQLQAVSRECVARGLDCESLLRVGDPTACLIEVAAAKETDLVVIGAPRPKGVPGYRCRVDLEKLVRALKVPLIIANGE